MFNTVYEFMTGGNVAGGEVEETDVLSLANSIVRGIDDYMHRAWDISRQLSVGGIKAPKPIAVLGTAVKVAGGILDAYDTFKDMYSAINKMKAFATIYYAGSPGQLYIDCLTRLMNNDRSGAYDMAAYVKMGIFDGIDGVQLTAAVLMAYSLE